MWETWAPVNDDTIVLVCYKVYCCPEDVGFLFPEGVTLKHQSGFLRLAHTCLSMSRVECSWRIHSQLHFKNALNLQASDLVLEHTRWRAAVPALHRVYSEVAGCKIQANLEMFFWVLGPHLKNPFRCVQAEVFLPLHSLGVVGTEKLRERHRPLQKCCLCTSFVQFMGLTECMY